MWIHADSPSFHSDTTGFLGLLRPTKAHQQKVLPRRFSPAAIEETISSLLIIDSTRVIVERPSNLDI